MDLETLKSRKVSQEFEIRGGMNDESIRPRSHEFREIPGLPRSPQDSDFPDRVCSERHVNITGGGN